MLRGRHLESTVQRSSRVEILTTYQEAKGNGCVCWQMRAGHTWVTATVLYKPQYQATQRLPNRLYSAGPLTPSDTIVRPTISKTLEALQTTVEYNSLQCHSILHDISPSLRTGAASTSLPMELRTKN